MSYTWVSFGFPLNLHLGRFSGGDSRGCDTTSNGGKPRKVYYNYTKFIITKKTIIYTITPSSCCALLASVEAGTDCNSFRGGSSIFIWGGRKRLCAPTHITSSNTAGVQGPLKGNTLLKSDVTSRDQVVRYRGSQECGSRFVNFACQFHWRWHSLRITLKSTTLLFMRSSNV